MRAGMSRARFTPGQPVYERAALATGGIAQPSNRNCGNAQRCTNNPISLWFQVVGRAAASPPILASPSQPVIVRVWSTVSFTSLLYDSADQRNALPEGRGERAPLSHADAAEEVSVGGNGFAKRTRSEVLVLRGHDTKMIDPGSLRRCSRVLRNDRDVFFVGLGLARRFDLDLSDSVSHEPPAHSTAGALQAVTTSS